MFRIHVSTTLSYTVIVWKQEAVTEEYLNERSHYRETGIKTKRYMRGKFVPRDILNDPPLDKDGNYRSLYFWQCCGSGSGCVHERRSGSWLLKKFYCEKNSIKIMQYMFLKIPLWRTIPGRFIFVLFLFSDCFAFWDPDALLNDLSLAVSDGEVELHSFMPSLSFSRTKFVLRENYTKEGYKHKK